MGISKTSMAGASSFSRCRMAAVRAFQVASRSLASATVMSPPL